MPNTRHSKRSEHAAISLTFIMPSTSSMRHSMPMRRLRLSLRSNWSSMRCTNNTSAALFALVSMMVSSFSPAPATTSMMSSWHHCVSTSLMRTHRVRGRQSRALTASTTMRLADSLALGATASSKSRKTWSISKPAALAIIFSELPGTESWQRRGLLGCLFMWGRLIRNRRT